MELINKKYRLKAFGVAREIVGGREISVEVDGQTVAALRQQLLKNYPALTSLRSLMVAVNNEYADDSRQISQSDEIAIIPPVSGG